MRYSWTSDLLPDRGGDRITGRTFASRSTVIAPQGMVATSQPLATQVAVTVLARGGHAVDAAIAANVMLGLLEPASCGLGGDLCALVWDARTRRLHGLNATGRSPHALTRESLTAQGLSRMPLRGPLSITVPGAVDGWAELHQRFGRLPLADLLAPTIRYAEDGVPITDLTAHEWQQSARLLSDQPGFAAAWVPGGATPKMGERWRNPDLARTLEQIATLGREAFYAGKIAAAIAGTVEQYGGYLRTNDLAGHTSSWVEPVKTNYRGYDVWQLPPSTQGIAVLQMLNLLAGYELASMGFGSADHLHHLIEAKKLVFADRARFYADPEHSAVPVAELIASAYADARRRLLAADRASLQPYAGDPLLDRGDTVAVVVADAERNMVSLMQSLFLPMGSGITPRGLGFLLQNRGALFALEAGHANAYAPRKRPFHTIIPSFVTRADTPYLCFGVMGGAAQPQIEIQVLINLLDFKMGLQEAGDAPRVLHEGSAEPTGEPAQGSGRVLLESGFPYTSVRELILRGHQIGAAVGLFGGYQAIRYDPEQDVLHGASESRQDGQAAGY